MNYEKPEVKAQKFSAEAFLGEIDFSATGNEGGGNPDIDDSNLGEIGHEILENIFNLNP